MTGEQAHLTPSNEHPISIEPNPRRVRIDDRALLHLICTWLKAGIVDTDGQVVPPETGTPQGGTVSPVLANVSLHSALDIWFEKVVKPRCRGEARLCR